MFRARMSCFLVSENVISVSASMCKKPPVFVVCFYIRRRLIENGEKKCKNTVSLSGQHMRKEGLSQWVVHEFVFSEEVVSKQQGTIL